MSPSAAAAPGPGRDSVPLLGSGRYRAPWWLPGGHAQTIWPALGARRPPATPWRRERWRTSDGDFVDVDFLDAGAAPDAPMLVLFHGLEGSSASHYARAFAHAAREARWRFAVPHFRGCSGEINLAPRAYHSGDFEEVGWMLQRLRERAGAPLHAVGISLGGNALMRWAQEAGDTAGSTARAVAAVCSPLDLAAGGHAIGRGFNRLVYTRMFLRTMVPKALAKLAQHPGLFDRERLLAARDLYEFDDVFTAPLHGFAGTDDYWRRASARPHLQHIRIPALLLNARNDPFVPAASLPGAADAGRFVTLWQPAHGGHVGFAHGAFPGQLMALPASVMAWLRAAGG
ncbi:MAG: alpha/beta fold hydrolase [Burkholderiaceae bacterium]